MSDSVRQGPEWIVGEASKNWPNDDRTTVSEMFEIIVNKNWQRGYAVHSFAFATTVLSEGKGMIETIIAIFRRVDPTAPFTPLPSLMRDGPGQPWRKRD